MVPAPRKPEVLIVDDETLICRFLEEVVRSLGAQSTSARTAAEATALIDAREFDCALIDKNLPDKSGVEVLRHLKAVRPRTEALMITGYANVDSALEALRLGAFDYLLKPFDGDTLTHRLKLALERRSMLSENARMEALLVHADRMASVGTLAAGIGHEINNPLAFLLSNLEYLERELPTLLPGEGADPTARRKLAELQVAIEESREGAQRVSAIVRDLRTFARSEDDVDQPVDARKVCESAAKMALPQIRHRAKLTQSLSEVPPVKGNEGRLAQVVLNLLINASQAIPEGDAGRHEIHLLCRRDVKGMVAIDVRDTGAGIPPEVLSRIFDPFFTTKEVGIGTGLGLSICHGIVTAMGGEIEVESRLGEGTIFRVVLPPSSAEVRAPLRGVAPPAGKRGRVLVIDDEPMIGFSVTRLLEGEHDVTALSDPREAQARLIAGERYDAVLCDLMMPGVSGDELHAAVERANPDQAARMVFLTGGAVTARARGFIEAMRGRTLLKPFDLTQLRTALRGVLDT